MDCNPPGSSVCRIFQARILTWFAIFSSRGSSQHREVTWASCVSYIGRWILYHCATWKAGDMKMIHFDHGMKTKNWIALTRRGQSDYANIPIIKEDLQFVNIFFLLYNLNIWVQVLSSCRILDKSLVLSFGHCFPHLEILWLKQGTS